MDRWRAARAVVVTTAALATGALGVAACLVNFEAVGPVAAADAAVGPSTAPPDPCAALPARRDGGALAATANVPPILFAAYTFALKADGDPLLCDEPGFDIDGIDTGPPGVCDNPACRALPSTGVHNSAKCDAPGGVDNAGLALFNKVAQVPGAAPQLKAITINDYVRRGLLNLLVELTDYNGQEEDDQVTANFYLSSGMDGITAKPNGLKEVVALPLVWDGTQPDTAWVVDERSVRSEGRFVFPRQTATGYVRQGLLAIPSTGSGVTPSLFGEPTTFDDGIFLARIVRDGGRYRLTHGRMGMRLPSRVFLNSIGRFVSGATQLCDKPNAGPYAILRDVVCGYLDLPTGPVNPNVDCDTLSFSLAFLATEARLALTESSELKLGQTFVGAKPACPDDAGTEWCDDCAWPETRRCAATDGGIR